MMYKGYEIDRNLLAGKFTVCLNGDECVFNTMKEAIEAIDAHKAEVDAEIKRGEQMQAKLCFYND